MLLSFQSSLLLLLMIYTRIRGETRCYCNLPSCVATSYMCKTRLGQSCFSTDRGRHGCTDSCDGRTSCCNQDMCNYDNSHVDASHSNDTNYGSTAQKGVLHFPEDLWFKAAVIAVPIAGSFILVVLILLASHMLRQDSLRSKQHRHGSMLLPSGHHRQQFYWRQVDSVLVDEKFLLPPWHHDKLVQV